MDGAIDRGEWNGRMVYEERVVVDYVRENPAECVTIRHEVAKTVGSRRLFLGMIMGERYSKVLKGGLTESQVLN